IAVSQDALLDTNTVDPRAVGRTEVDQQEAVAVGTDLGVVAADVRVGQHDVGVRSAADADRVLAEREALAGREHQAPRAGASRALPEASLDLEPTGVEGLVDHQLDVDRPHEAVLLVTGMGP